MTAKKSSGRQTAISIPLTFDQAIGGLLAVKPTPKSSAKKKPASKK